MIPALFRLHFVLIIISIFVSLCCAHEEPVSDDAAQTASFVKSRSYPVGLIVDASQTAQGVEEAVRMAVSEINSSPSYLQGRFVLFRVFSSLALVKHNLAR